MNKSKHVIFMTIDAMRPDGLAKANTPIIDHFIANGASTMTAQTVYPPVTLPVHSSLFYGVDPTTHGIVNNAFPLNANVQSFTTLFDHLANNGKRNLAYSTWEKFRNTYTNIDTADLLHMEKICDDYYNLTPESKPIYTKNYHAYTKDFIETFVKRQPDVAYIYLEMPDVYGHNYNWMSDEYIDSISITDIAVGIIMDGLKGTDIEKDVTIIITSDHGGHDNTHGKDIPEDMTIPWIAYGKNIKKDYQIKTDVSILDTTTTICDLLGVIPHKSYQGKILNEIYA